MANGMTLSGMLGADPMKVQAAQMGRGAMNMVGQPGQMGQPMGPPAMAPQVFAPMQGAPPVQAGMPMGQGMLSQQLMQPAAGAMPGMTGDPLQQLIMVIPSLPPEQIFALLQQIPDPATQQQFLQLVLQLNPAFAQAMGMGAVGPQMQPGMMGPEMMQPGMEAMAPPEYTGIPGPEQEFATLGGALGA